MIELLTYLIPSGLLLIVVMVSIIVFYSNTKRDREDIKISQKKTEEAESKLTEIYNKSNILNAKPYWDIARVTLDKYFTQNLAQIKYIFWLSVAVMLLGFGMILSAILFNIMNKTDYYITIAGVITEFIGATFLFIYRSSAKQANEYSRTLERINSIGMAMQVIESMTDDSSQKNMAKSHLVELLVRQTYNINDSQSEDDNSKKA